MIYQNYTPLRHKIIKTEGKKKKPTGFLLILFAILSLSLFAIIRQTSKETEVTISKKMSTKNTKAVLGIESNSGNLEEIIDKALQGSSATYAVAIKNFKTNETFYLNKHRKFLSASLYKLWVMAVVFEQIKEGRLKEDDFLKQDVTVLNEKFNIATDEAELSEGEVEMSVNEALNEMITVSDNYSALLLTEKVGVDSIRDFLLRNDFKESVISQTLPTTTVHDIALFYEKLYQGELADKEFTEKMIDLLKRQKLNETLPKYLSEDIAIAHKTGQLDPVAHDAGIVYTNKGDYIIVLLSESTDIFGAKERMAGISEAVYNYFFQ